MYTTVKAERCWGGCTQDGRKWPNTVQYTEATWKTKVNVKGIQKASILLYLFLNLSVPTQSWDLRCSDSLSSRRHPTPTHVGLVTAWSHRLPADASSGSIKLLLSACCVQSPELCWPEKTLVHPAPIMCLLKENIGPSHIPGLPFPPVPTHGLRGSKEPLRALVRPTGHNKKASPLVQTHKKGRKP